jgi:hypothetical protein
MEGLRDGGCQVVEKRALESVFPGRCRRPKAVSARCFGRSGSPASGWPRQARSTRLAARGAENDRHAPKFNRIEHSTAHSIPCWLSMARALQQAPVMHSGLIRENAQVATVQQATRMAHEYALGMGFSTWS